MNAMDVALICKALGDANRLEIVQMLSDGEKCGCKLLERFEITQPTLSHDEFSGNIVANSYLNCCICLKIKKYLMSLPHLPTSANFHQDIILHIQEDHQWRVRLMHSLILMWFLSPFQLPNSQCGAYSQQRYKHQYCCAWDCILQILFSSYLISLRELIAEYDFVAKQLYQMDDVTKLMLEIARAYKSNADAQEGVDSIYGTGFASYMGEAIEAFYSR